MSEIAGALRPVLQKLLTAGLGAAIVEDGYDQVSGIVIHAGDLARSGCPGAAFGRRRRRVAAAYRRRGTGRPRGRDAGRAGGVRSVSAHRRARRCLGGEQRTRGAVMRVCGKGEVWLAPGLDQMLATYSRYVADVRARGVVLIGTRRKFFGEIL